MPPPLPPPLPAPRRKTWWERNWPWVAIPGGLLFLALFVGGAFAGFSWITKHIRESEGYKLAIATVRADHRIQVALGEPIDDSQFVTGSFVNTNQMKTLMATVPLKGPKGSATMVVNAVEMEGTWHFQVLSVTLRSTNEVLDLRGAANQSEKNRKKQ